MILLMVFRCSCWSLLYTLKTSVALWKIPLDLYWKHVRQELQQTFLAAHLKCPWDRYLTCFWHCYPRSAFHWFTLPPSQTGRTICQSVNEAFTDASFTDWQIVLVLHICHRHTKYDISLTQTFHIFPQNTDLFTVYNLNCVQCTPISTGNILHSNLVIPEMKNIIFISIFFISFKEVTGYRCYCNVKVSNQ